MDRNRDRIGHTPGREFGGGSDDYSIKVAIVQRVDEINLKADLKIITGVAAERFEISLTQAMYGPRSFWGGIPEVNSFVVVGYRRIQSKIQEATILGYLPTAIRTSWRFDPVSADDPNNVDPNDTELFEQVFGPTTRFKRLYLRMGDVGGMSAAGSEFVLSKDVRMVNRGGDLLELRDVDRTLVSSSIHRVETDAGIRRISGPIRRGAMYLPDDIFSEAGVLKDENSTPNPYYGRDELQAAGPGATNGQAPKFAFTNGKVLDLFNDTKTFPPVTYANGRRVYYPSTVRGASVDDPEAFANAFVEQRLELSHTTDLVQEVLEEIDGFSVDRRLPYIEHVLGTLVGNTLNSTQGQRQYAQVLKPKLFEEFNATKAGKFVLDVVDRRPTAPDTEVNTVAGAYLFRVRPPQGRSGADDPFVASVSKQGKIFVSAPGSTVENYASGEKNVSAEISLGGALKAYLGASNPNRISAHITLEGGLHLDIGRDAQGNAITVQYHSGVKTLYDGNPNQDDVADDVEVRGVKRLRVTGRKEQLIEGTKLDTVSGMYQVRTDRYNMNAISGVSINAGELNQMISGKSQLNYALQVLENIALGGKILTILAGGLTQSVLAGATTYTTAAGATTFNNPAGAFNVVVGTGSLGLTVGAGAVTLSTGAGAMSLGAGAGAISVTAGLAINLTASTMVSMLAPQVLVGGPAAVLGVCRGVPALPPGAPTLDIITNIPLQGSVLFRSF